MRKQRRLYKDGGPVEPNYQTLGNIKFDSNTSRPGSDGQQIVKDINTGKDFGVIRNNDGSYRWYSQKKLKDNVNVEVSDISLNLLEMIAPADGKAIRKLNPYLRKLSQYSHERPNGVSSQEEIDLREKLYKGISPYSYSPEYNFAYIDRPETAEKNSRADYLREYLGLSSEMKQSPYNFENKPAYQPIKRNIEDNPGDVDKYNSNLIYEEYRDLENPRSTSMVMKLGKSKSNLVALGDSGSNFSELGNYTLGRGKDDKGEYISIYDKWDMNPEKGLPDLPTGKYLPLPNINELNNPLTIYDRKYLSELSPAGRDSVYAVDKKLGIIPQDKRTQNKATGGHLQNNQMRKKRNCATGGFTGNPYQLAMQQAMAAANQYSTTNPNGLALDNTDIMGMAGGAAPLQLNPNQSTAIGAGSAFTNKRSKGALTGMQMPEISGGDPYAMAAQYVTGIAGDYKNAADYKAGLGAEKSQKDYNKEILMAGLTKGPIGMIPSIMRMNKDKNTVVSGSPGTYAFGGPVYPPGRPRQQSLAGMYSPQSSESLRIIPRPIQTPDFGAIARRNIMETSPERNQAANSGNQARFNELRDFQLGQLDWANTNTALGNYPRKTDFATGGQMDDQQLSNSSFQVKDDPNVTDGKSYPEYNANLDHNEVVDKKAKFVFSDVMNLPGTNKSFAKAVKPLYKKIGNLETRKDPISMATTEQINKQINTLAMTQEQLATALGLRNDRPQGMATGGPLPWEGFDVAQFEQWYNTMPGGTKIAVDGKWNKAKQKAYEAVAFDYMNATGKNTVNNIGGQSLANYANDQYVSVTPVGDKLLPSSIGKVSKIPAKPIYIDTPEGPVDIAQLDGSTPIPRVETLNDRQRRIMLPNGTQFDPSVMPDTPEAIKMSSTINDVSPAVTPLGGYTGNQGTTYGDILQGVEVGSKFFNIGQGAEQEKPLLNTSPITRAGYDVNPALYQNQRNFQNNINSIGSASAPQRRALTNSMLATKLNSDNQVLSNYQGMNNNANVQYEERIGQQRNQNIASMFRTNDMNAANRGAYDQAQQNAFTSLGNFGEAMNRKKMSNDTLALLKINYPDIYDSVMQDFDAAGIKRKTKVTTKVG